MPPEIDLAPADALRDGEMHAYPATPDVEVLLVRRQGQYRALAARCPHYGAPLEKGRIINDQLICPWHHACFRVDDGHLCQPPALDDLPTYPVRVADGRVWVTLPAHPTAAAESPDATPTALVGGTPPGPDRAAPDPRTFVLVGAGAAGQFAAQTLRAEGFGGRLVLVGADPAAPYDRTKLSKAFLAGKADKKALPLRQADFYQRHQIEILTDTRVTGLNLRQRQLQLEGRDPLRYDKLLLAPGCQPNTLPQLPGHELAGVLPLRTAQDAVRIREAATNARHVVIIGSSFIGMEAAASLAAEDEAAGNKNRRITVIARDKEPFMNVLGPKIGAMFRNLHRRHGVRFRAEADVQALEGENGRVTAVRLASGQRLPADVVVLGVGVRPATGFLAEAFELEKDGGLRVDAHLRAAEHVYVAGDVALFPLAAGLGQHRVEHWRLAQQHGACAARNMLGQEVAFAEVPFFWTQQFGKSLRYAGHATEWDEIIFHGDVRRQNFLALYAHRNRLVAAAALGRDDDMLVIMELLRRDQMPTPTAARRKTNWARLLDG
ncbi:FAD-dependent oxidoreductase [Hymenobacter actinosclerus]|uniref:NADPH-dependent 2,4-dienoyl-CoA reductase, sulfur reductase n=1 Tax=Hymenobacter actinosclerus TaxID=82805 RepID=A0A1I0J397_9BACT|nr:FAD-dependent oxidoreductase [Hymenobacter actinosclerus]SEU03542.1 NADPH-dependent 2,4-dienoyl-CoA reductase, sulfur reductase [Hymenobacter actinosclerus]